MKLNLKQDSAGNLYPADDATKPLFRHLAEPLEPDWSVSPDRRKAFVTLATAHGWTVEIEPVSP